MEHACFVGIDVSKAHLDVHVRPTGDSFRVSHDDVGFATLLERVLPLTPTVVVLKPPGATRSPSPPRRPGPACPSPSSSRQTADFAAATGASHSPLDARVIALFAEVTGPRRA